MWRVCRNEHFDTPSLTLHMQQCRLGKTDGFCLLGQCILSGKDILSLQELGKSFVGGSELLAEACLDGVSRPKPQSDYRNIVLRCLDIVKILEA